MPCIERGTRRIGLLTQSKALASWDQSSGTVVPLSAAASMLLTHPAASDAYSPLYCDAASSQNMLAERKKMAYYLDAGREIVSPGLRAAAVERVYVRGEYTGI